MTMSNEQRRLRYKNDEEYRKKISNVGKKKYKEDNDFREKKISYAVKYVRDHPIERSNYFKDYYKANKDYILNNVIEKQNNERREVIYWYSNGLMECSSCGEKHIEFLCVDHINNNGSVHRKEMGSGGNRIYKYLIKNNFPDGYQILCNNCNYLKEYNKDKILSTTTYAVTMRSQRSNRRLQTLYWYTNGSMKCECCGKDDIRILTFDHIYGGGKKHCESNKIKNLHDYLYYNNYPDGYRVLCWNCNKSYSQYGFCPHNIIVS